MQAAIHSGVDRTQNGRFLEQLRYSIIASQLLIEQSRPVHHRAHSNPNGHLPHHVDPQSFQGTAVSPKGATISGLSSFVVAWAFHSIRNQVVESSWSQGTKLGYITLLLLTVATALFGYFWRKRTQRIHHDAIDSMSTLVAESHVFDELISTSLTLIQEIEVVARGYELYVNSKNVILLPPYGI